MFSLSSSRFWRLSASVVAILWIFSSCSRENQVAPVQQNAANVATLQSFLAHATGTEIGKVVFLVPQQLFVIDQDVVMSLSDAQAHYAKFQQAFPAGGRTEQRRYTFLMTAPVAGSISIYVNPVVPAAWFTAIDQAISNWNGTNCQIRAFRTTSPSGARISITMNASLPSNVIAQASFPDAAGNCGPVVTINPAFNGLSASRKQFAMTHEFGHCFGFTHTNQSFGAVIPDTPVTDANSIMNSFVLDWNGFTFYDFIAYGVVYPTPPGTRRFLRYYNTINGDHFYTTNTGELGPAGFGGWVSEGSAGYIYPSPIGGTVPLYRYYNTSSGDHFYTTNFSELGNAGFGGWVYEGVAGYVSPSQVAGTGPLYRYYNTGNGDHFYTKNFGELGNGGFGGWIYEGIQCYIW